MPLYEYRCRTCDAVFEERRPMSASGDPATCPDGHEARRVLSVFMTAGTRSTAAAPAMAGGGGGGCCGGGCGCG